MSPNVISHLGLIQGIVNRMATCSFAFKAWAAALTAASYIFKGAVNNRPVLQCLIFTVILFTLWFLDSYYLWMERKFRALYDCIRTKEDTDFSMNTSMAIRTESGDMKSSCKYWNVVRSRTEWIFYTTLILVHAVYCLSVAGNSSEIKKEDETAHLQQIVIMHDK